MAQKAISDEQIISALLNHGTLKATAAALKISERALYDRMNTGEFQGLYKSARADLLRQAVNKINAQLEAAVDTVAEIMADKNNNPAVRLQAAQTLLNNVAKFTERLQKSEAAVISQEENNRFGLW